MLNIPYFEHLHFILRVLWFVGLTVAGWLFAKLLILLWEKLILPLASRTESSLDDHLSQNLHKPINRLLILGTFYLAALITLEPAREIKEYITPVENLIYLFLILFVAGMLNGVIKSLIGWYLQDIAPKTESTMDDTIFPIFRKAGAVIIYFIAATIILDRFKVNLTGLVATAGVASVAIAFGAQAALADIIAGFSLILDRSFHVGERIELKDGLIGDVLEIGLRSTRIMSLDQRLVIVPNREVAASRIINWSQPDPTTKVKLKIGVAMDENLDRVKKIIADICVALPSLAPDSPPVVVCTGFGPYFIELLILVTVDHCNAAGSVTDLLVIKLQEAFQKENVRLPLPAQQIQVQQVS